MSDLNLGVYNLNDVNLNVGGRTIQAVSEDEVARTERLDENEFSVRVGAKGHFTFQKNNNKAGAIIIVLKQNSPENVYFQSLKEGETLFDVSITTKHNHQEIVRGTSCMVGIAPRKTFGAEEADREWNLVTGQLDETDKAL